MKRELRYIVFKTKDIENLGPEDKADLAFLCMRINRLRKDRGKQELECVVVENDWPEYEEVWKLIETRVDNENPSP